LLYFCGVGWRACFTSPSSLATPVRCSMLCGTASSTESGSPSAHSKKNSKSRVLWQQTPAAPENTQNGKITWSSRSRSGQLGGSTPSVWRGSRDGDSPNILPSMKHGPARATEQFAAVSATSVAQQSEAGPGLEHPVPPHWEHVTAQQASPLEDSSPGTPLLHLKTEVPEKRAGVIG